MQSRDIEGILAEELRLAGVAFNTATANLREITSDIPSRIPQPDGTARIQNAGSTYRDALNAYVAALRHFNAYIMNGTVPPHLADKDGYKLGGSNPSF